ncbi:rhomboid family intramembrane serine protease [Rhodoferax sp. AJA081-3]|uniref:rhomboid family intramembrane serine protease n=1 Tax=Rhodoferax sp. AJA081-3 TaxID=2752316 RepID=UPI001ADEF082|nr:rhomboid family intramembrane serine protease [Rhodoferax sp. AJA081-3]
MAEPVMSLATLMAAPPRRAPVTATLLAVNIGVFLLMLLAGAGFWHTPNGVQLAWGANFGPATQDGQWWRLFTALFIHFGVVHLALNMWALWDVGRLVEQLYGRWRFAGLYVVSGLLGNLLSLVLHGNQAVSGGASGAIFSLYGALLVFLWRARRSVEPGEFRWLFGAALLFSSLMLGVGFVVPGIDNAAHGGGLLAGALLGLVLAPAGGLHGRTPSRGLAWGTAALIVAVTAVLVWRLPEPSYRFSEEQKAREAIQQFLGEDQRTSRRWGSLLANSARNGLTFDELAGQIDADIAAVYERSFEQLEAAQPGGAAPSAPKLEQLQAYANERAEAARELSQGLREQDREQIQRALEHARQASSKPAPE